MLLPLTMICLLRRTTRPSSLASCTPFDGNRYVTIPSRSKKRGQSGPSARKTTRQVIVNDEPVNSLLNPFSKGHHHVQENKKQPPHASLAQVVEKKADAGLNRASTSRQLYGSSDPFNSASRETKYDQKSILDKVFKDRGPNNVVTRKTHILGLKGRPYVMNDLNSAIPMVTCANDIHGVPSFLVQHAYALRFLQNTPVAHNCKYFTAYYLPPFHFLSLARKSRPAVLSTFTAGAEYNGNPDFTPSAGSNKQQQQQQPQQQQPLQRSRNPMSYAFARKHITQKTRDALWNAFQKMPETAVDGLYLFRSHNYPNDVEDLQKHADELVRKASVIAKRDTGWVETFNRKIKWSAMDGICRKRLIPPLPRIS